METPPETNYPLQLTVSLGKGMVVFPAWLAILFVVLFFLAALGDLILWQANSETTTQVIKEIRVLQLHAQDIESVLIRSGAARRQDFAPWGPGAPKHDPNR